MSYLYGHQSEDIRRLQAALIEHGFSVGPDGADGGFGDDTLAAVKAAQEAYGHDPNGVVDLALLLELGVETPKPKKPNLLTNWLIGLAIKQVASRLKGLPMLSGAKTYITAAVLAIVAVYSLIFGDLPGVGHVDPSSAIMELLASLGLVFGRSGAKADVKKAIEE